MTQFLTKNEIKDEIFCVLPIFAAASTTQNIGYPSIMTPSKMGKTKQKKPSFIFYSVSNGRYFVKLGGRWQMQEHVLDLKCHCVRPAPPHATVVDASVASNSICHC